MMRYADSELADRPEDQYEDTLSPPLFLLITLLLSQGLSNALPSVIDPTAAVRQLGSQSNLLIARGVIFGIYPLCMAVTLLRWKSIRITRDTLRPPFFSQCYVAAPFALGLVLGIDLVSLPQNNGVIAGLVVIGVAFAWYGQAQVRWFIEDFGMSAIKATLVAALALLIATIAALLVAIIINLDASAIATEAG
jgi:hypothetical protein